MISTGKIITSPLAAAFYARDTAEVARELLGKYLVREIDGRELGGLIVETEAYYGRGDAASHAARGPTPRSAVMFGPAGRAYVYFNYGMHFLLNVVTEAEGTAGAVLIRALEPVSGLGIMRRNRPVKKLTELTNGPGKLTQALAVDLSFNGRPLYEGDLRVYSSKVSDFAVAEAPRIGISAGREHLYRFFIKGNRFVSRR